MNPSEVGSLLARGQPREALALAARGVEAHPQDSNWLHLLGAAQFSAGAGRDAAATLRKAVALAPLNAVYWNTLGAVLVELGDHAEAERALQEAVRLQGDYREALFNLAISLRKSGRFEEAKASLGRIRSRWPGFLPAQFELAAVLVDDGDVKSALPLLGPLLARAPTDARLLVLAAVAFQAAGDATQALAACERALSQPAIGAREIATLAKIHGDLGRDDAAVALATRAAAMAPDSADVRAIAGDVLALVRRHPQAQEHYASAAVHRPRDIDLLGKLGLSSLAAGKVDVAAQAFRDQLRVVPGLRAAHQSLANALTRLGREDEAIGTLMEALEAGHRDCEILTSVVNLKGRNCDWDGLDELVRELRAKALEPGETPAHPQTSLYLEDVTAREQRVWAEHWARVQLPARPAIGTPRTAARADGPLRLGYLSSDFHEHATSMLMIGMLERHDRSRFEVYAYSSGPPEASAMRDRIAGSVDHFVDLRDHPIRAAAARIAEDGIDVLVDLGGYVKRSRMEILAYRPARVQGHFLGYPGTTGAPFVDFFIADGVTVPEGHDDTFTERVLRMPGCYQPNDPRRPLPAKGSRVEWGLPDDALVLVSFNQAVKIRPRVFEQWCRLLQALPGAHLWLLDPGPAPIERLRSFAQSRGIDPARLVVAPQVAPPEHLSRLASADLAIDTFPYCSHTTASDALWAGVPLITTCGETFASRVAASVLAAAGCADWAFEDPARAFDATVAMGRDPQLRAKARGRVERSRASTLFDADTFTRNFERSIETAAGKARDG